MINLVGIKKSFGDKVIFNDFTLKVQDGEFVSIVGESGKGKTTLLNIIGGIEKVDNGYIEIDSEKIRSRNLSKILRDKISYLFQNYALIENETVERNLLVGLKYKKVNKQEKKELVADALREVGLAGYEKKKVFHLSGGEQQRVALARIIVKNSDIILADEPTGNLDIKNAEKVMDILKGLNNKGKTIIMVTHNNKLASDANKIVDLG